jgi:hypothetical protein
MSDTTTITPPSGTVSASVACMTSVQIAPVSGEIVTQSEQVQFSGVSVRATISPVSLKFQPSALADQQALEKMNERIRKYGKAF